jgi:hypothetical protein
MEEEKTGKPDLFLEMARRRMAEDGKPIVVRRDQPLPAGRKVDVFLELCRFRVHVDIMLRMEKAATVDAVLADIGKYLGGAEAFEQALGRLTQILRLWWDQLRQEQDPHT